MKMPIARQGLRCRALVASALVAVGLAAGTGAPQEDGSEHHEFLQNIARTFENEGQQQDAVAELYNEEDLAKGVIEKADGPSDEQPPSLDEKYEPAPDRTAPPPALPEGDSDVSGGASGTQLVKYVQDRLASAELENKQLRQLLAQADNYETGLWNKVLKFKQTAGQAIKQGEVELKAVPKLKARINELKAEAVKEAKESEQERKVALSLKAQVSSARAVAERSGRALGWTRQHLNSIQKQNGELVKLIRNTTLNNQDLGLKLNESVQDEISAQENLKMQMKQLANKDQEFKSQKTLKDLEATKAKLEKQAELAEAKVKPLHQREEAAEKNIENMRKQLAETKKQIEAEKAVNKKLIATSQELGDVIDHGRENASRDEIKLQRMDSTIKVLEKKTKLLQHRASDGKHAAIEAEGALKKAKENYREVATEVTHLRGAGPWLEAKVAAEEKELQSVTAKAKLAYEERDAEKAMLGEAQAKLAQLEQQYAGVVQVLGRNKDAASAESQKDDASSDAAVVEADIEAGNSNGGDAVEGEGEGEGEGQADTTPSPSDADSTVVSFGQE